MKMKSNKKEFNSSIAEAPLVRDAILNNLSTAMDAYGMLSQLFHDPPARSYRELRQQPVPASVQSILYSALSADLLLSVARIFDPPVTLGTHENASLARLHQILLDSSELNKYHDKVTERADEFIARFNDGPDAWRNKLLAHTDLAHLRCPDPKFPTIDLQDLWIFLTDIEHHVLWISRLLKIGNVFGHQGNVGQEAAERIFDAFYRSELLHQVGCYVRNGLEADQQLASQLITKPALWEDDPSLCDLLDRSTKAHEEFLDRLEDGKPPIKPA